jgi:hypothetical protein
LGDSQTDIEANRRDASGSNPARYRAVHRTRAAEDRRCQHAYGEEAIGAIVRRNDNASLAGSSLSRKAGRPREHVTPKEANRAKQQAFRDRKKAAKHKKMAEKYGTNRDGVACKACAASPTGCCSACKHMHNKLLKDLGLRVERGTCFARHPLVTGDNDSTRMDEKSAASTSARHGRGVSFAHDGEGNIVKQGRFTRQAGTYDVLQVQIEHGLDANPTRSTQRQQFLDRLSRTLAYIRLRQAHPELSKEAILEQLAATPEGRADWKRVQAGEVLRGTF